MPRKASKHDKVYGAVRDYCGCRSLLVGFVVCTQLICLQLYMFVPWNSSQKVPIKPTISSFTCGISVSRRIIFRCNFGVSDWRLSPFTAVSASYNMNKIQIWKYFRWFFYKEIILILGIYKSLFLLSWNSLWRRCFKFRHQFIKKKIMLNLFKDFHN